MRTLQFVASHRDFHILFLHQSRFQHSIRRIRAINLSPVTPSYLTDYLSACRAPAALSERRASVRLSRRQLGGVIGRRPLA